MALKVSAVVFLDTLTLSNPLSDPSFHEPGNLPYMYIRVYIYIYTCLI